MLQIYDHKMKKMSTIDISNIGNILYNIEDRTIAINIGQVTVRLYLKLKVINCWYHG